jgi:hypothetical protein
VYYSFIGIVSNFIPLIILKNQQINRPINQQMSYFNLNNLADAPLIPANTNYDTNYSGNLRVTSVRCSSFTDGVATLSNGFFSGISDPVNAQDAVPKSYIVGAVPGGTARTIQYNNNGLFGGSNNLTYVSDPGGTSGTVSLTGSFTDGYLVMTGGYLSGITESSNSSSAITRRYCDFLNRNNVTSVTSTRVVATTYGPSSIINGTIIRSSTVNNTDTLPTANSIISYLNNQSDLTVTSGSLATANLYYTFSMINQGSTYISINSNTGLTMNNTSVISSVAVPPGYTLNATVWVNSVSPANVVVDITAINCNTVYMSNTFTPSGFSTFLPYSVGNNLLVPGPVNGTSNTVSNYTYTKSDVQKGIIVRDPSGMSVDAFEDLRINTSLVIQNVSTTSSITISASDCTGSWTFIPTGSLLIAESKSTILYFYNTGTNNYLNIMGSTTMT